MTERRQQMNRTLATWQKADPKAMAFSQSPTACMHALADMKSDLMMMAELLRRIAMPSKGQKEDNLTIDGMPAVLYFAGEILREIPSHQWHEWEESK
jgi:hypothetical protein